MTHQPDEAVDVLRAVWAAEGQDARSPRDDDCGPTKSCRNMKDVSFDGHGRAGHATCARPGGTGCGARAS